MSYDLMVFEPSAAPAGREAFLQWFEGQSQWGEAHDYNDPACASRKLQAWFLDMIAAFPAMNGPHASEDFENPKIADYCIGTAVIYATFRWSEVEDAYKAMFEAARMHGVGFFDVSADDGQVWMPDGADGLVCAHGTGCSA